MKRLPYALALLFCLLALSCAKKPTVDDVVQKQVQTQGGAAALAAITDQVSKWEAKFSYPMGDSMVEATVELIITYKRPNKIKFEMFNPDGSTASATVFDGSHGWQYMMGQGVRDMAQSEMDENNYLAETWIDGLHDYAAKAMKLELLPDTTLAGKALNVLRVTDRFGNASLNYFDPQTGLATRSEVKMTDPTSMAKMPFVMTYENYTAFAGFMAAGLFKQYDERGALMFEAALKELQNNANVADEAFVAPVAEEPAPAEEGEESAPEEEAQM
jgi:outer membrane lipoprotein-sorting protein